MKYLLAPLFAAILSTASLAQDTLFAPDPTGAVSSDGVYTPPPISSLDGAFENAVALTDDPRITAWIALQQSRDFEGLLRATEADLRADAPHPFATHVWAWTQWALGNLSVDTLPEMPTDLAEPLTFASRAFAYATSERFDLLSAMADEALARPAPDYLADIEIIYAARDFGQPDKAILLSQRMVEYYPYAFSASFFTGDEARDGRTNSIEWLDTKPELDGTPAARLIRWLAAHGDLETTDLRHVVEHWLEHAPNDPDAIRRAAYQLEDHQRYEEAAALFEREHAVYPFRDAVQRVARINVAARNFTEAMTALSDWAQLSQPASLRAEVEAALQIKAYRSEGELGRARQVGLVALDTEADGPIMRLQLAKSLSREGFPQEVVSTLEPLVNDNITNQPLIGEYVIALNDTKRHRDALRMIDTFRSEGGIVSDGMANQWTKALRELERFEDIDTVLEFARTNLPNQYWVQDNIAWSLNKAGRTEEAYGIIRALILQNSSSNWRIRRLEDYARKTGQEDDALVILEALVNRFPYRAQGWKTLASMISRPDYIWREAIEKAPLESFPTTERALHEFKRNPQEWRSITAKIEVELARMHEAGAEDGELALVYRERARIADEAIYEKVSNDLSDIPITLSFLDRARELGIPEKDYWHTRFYVIGRSGPSPERTAAALKRAEMRPDDEDPFNHLFQTEVGEHLPNPATSFIYFSRHLSRTPRDAEKLEDFALYHNKYGGSAVVALSLLERAKRWDPDFEVEKETEFAYGKLGAQKRYYEQRYNRGAHIDNSSRYISWFENARAEAKREQATIKNLDLDGMKILLRRPDGIEEERHYHPIFGRVLYYRVGAFEVSSSYTEDGYLSQIKIGEQKTIELEYGDLLEDGIKRGINRVIIDGDQEVRIEYDQNGNAAVTNLVGKGRIESTYDDNGSILETELVLEDTSLSGFEVSQGISAYFGRLMSDNDILQRAENGELSDFDLQDLQLDALRDAVWNAYSDSAGFNAAEQQALLRKSAYLIENVGDHPYHQSEADADLEGVFYVGIEAANDPSISVEDRSTARLVAVEAVRYWRQLMLRTRPDGLPRNKWELWTSMRAWTFSQTPDDPEVVGAIARLRAEMDKSSLRALSNSGWLQKSDLTNPGFWRNFNQKEVFPKLLVDGDFRMRDVLVRQNGDVVVASNVGIAVLRRGYWEWFAYDETLGRLSPTLDYTEINGASNFSSLAEDDMGRLWLGSRAGLIMLDGAYDAELTFWRGGNAELFAGGVNDVANNDGRVAIAGDEGLVVADTASLTFTSISDEAVMRLRKADDGFLVIGRNALWWQADQTRIDLTNEQATDAMLGPDGASLFVLSGNALQATSWNEAKAGNVNLQGVEGHEAINATAPPYGLAQFDLGQGQLALTVLYDKGGAVLGEGGFESFSKPNRTRPVAIYEGHERDGRLFMITNEGISAIVRGEAKYSYGARVYDLLSDPALEVTFVATGGSIDTVDHTDPNAEPNYFSGVNARILELAPDGALISHDGPVVIRFEQGAIEAQELFETEQTVDGSDYQAEISDILAASDGSIWAIAGASVFRWTEGSPLREYSMFKREPDFPVFSDLLHSLHETADGRILLVASNEGHRGYKSQNLYGGLFEFNGQGFVRSNVDRLGSWFITGHTQISEDTAIVGTTSGFARLRGNTLEEFDQIEDPSYMAMRDVQPALYLGTDGAQLGEDLWLFGSAGGVVAHKGVNWFYPDRLNWILPGRDFANYGARAVHAIATDPGGRVYIGTDWGLTVYDPGGAGAQSFLITEQRADFAFSAFERERMNEVNEVLLDALPDDSSAGKLAATFRKNRKKLVELEESIVLAQESGRDLDKLEKDLRRTQQRDIAILAKLEQEEPLLFNMLQLNPLDLRALGRKMPGDVVVVQYLPTDTALYINLVGEDQAELKQVAVSRAEIDHAVSLVTRYLADQARGKKRGFDVAKPSEEAAEETSNATDTAAAINPVLKVPNEETATQALKWLYDTLLRPVEHSLDEDATLVISPAGSLAYLPFSALIRESQNGKPVYAIEHFDLATAPSLYALDLMINAAPSTAFSHLVVGDPDGSLEHARAEAEAIADILADDLVELRIGEEATYDELLTYSADARFVHLAMHGKLDHLSPKDSYLLLAENRRMSIPQIMTLPMSETELVFLSACETALGTNGLEFRTIAHAFAHAGAPAIVATLWQVEDKATRTLAENFYNAKVDGATNAEALGQAQRDMIAAGGDHAAPGFWAAAVVMGKP